MFLLSTKILKSRRHEPDVVASRRSPDGIWFLFGKGAVVPRRSPEGTGAKKDGIRSPAVPGGNRGQKGRDQVPDPGGNRGIRSRGGDEVICFLCWRVFLAGGYERELVGGWNLHEQEVLVT